VSQQVSQQVTTTQIGDFINSPWQHASPLATVCLN